MTSYIDYHLNPYYDRQYLKKHIEEVKTPENELAEGQKNQEKIACSDNITQLFDKDACPPHLVPDMA